MLRASSRCAVAIIALRNSPKWNCCLRLEPQAKGKQLQQRLEKSQGPRDGRQPESARWRDSQLRSSQEVASGSVMFRLSSGGS